MNQITVTLTATEIVTVTVTVTVTSTVPEKITITTTKTEVTIKMTIMNKAYVLILNSKFPIEYRLAIEWNIFWLYYYSMSL